jgi:hypothetical protein
MKKLLAMILCVAMVMSLAPAAFAAGTTGGEYNDDDEYARGPHYTSAGAAKKLVTDLGKDMKAMYYAIAADEAVFGTAKGIYDMTDGMAKELLKDTDKLTYYVPDPADPTDPTKAKKVTIYQEDLIDNVRSGFNHIIGNEIANYLTKHSGSFTDDDNHIKPEKYMNTFVKAVNEALTSNKAQKNIQALVYGLAALNLQKSVNDRADDLYDEIVEWDHWKEFYWTNHVVGIDEETGRPIIVADQVTKPHDAFDDYTWMWMPTGADTNTVLAPTGSDNTAADSILSNAMLRGWLS